MDFHCRVRPLAGALLIGFWLGSGNLARADAPPPTPTETDPAALTALGTMGNYLRGLKQFALHAESETDQVLEGGQAVEFRHRTDLVAVQPNKMTVTVDNGKHAREFFYNGKNFTLYDRASGYFANGPAPASIDLLVDDLAQRYGIELPLADLFRWQDGTAAQIGISTALVIGTETLGNQTCTHYVFRQPEIDWQLWLRQGAEPLPCRLVITRRDEPAQPRHSVDFTWNLSPPAKTSQFTFTPPAGARAVPLVEVGKVDDAAGAQP